MSDPTIAGSSPSQITSAEVQPQAQSQSQLANPNSQPTQNGTTSTASINAEAGPSSPRNNGPSQSEDVVMTNGETTEADTNVDQSKADGTMDEPNANALEEEDTRPDLTELFAARRAEELERRDRSLVDFLKMLDGYKPLIPEEVTEYYLQRSGFECSDPRLKRLLSLSAQKFISDLSRDAYQFAKLRVNGTNAGGRGRPNTGGVVSCCSSIPCRKLGCGIVKILE
ncbi:hypothetical protein L486_06223 [Kwoniella mangroviensis CBS 10435]|uniref:Transcription initiation factor TFIID subunit 10 n=1 Tax=Kwoniella mangroviensis CBS 10435 TaxID=1331196 RepID=A0A1B9IL61_9TREE|nr:hypothetical protein L486_06223 [Kwoniella mangroviensis CBS 10435]OCF79032.1 hypothetical protein I204_00976 [Kwoniella mangroviensis CBS 8886]